jgi:hypothetical protein
MHLFAPWLLGHCSMEMYPTPVAYVLLLFGALTHLFAPWLLGHCNIEMYTGTFPGTFPGAFPGAFLGTFRGIFLGTLALLAPCILARPGPAPFVSWQFPWHFSWPFSAWL